MSRLTQSAVVTAAGALTFGLSASAFAAPTTHGAPVTIAAPAHAPAATETGGSCITNAKLPSGGSVGSRNLVWLRSHPTGVIIVWTPGLNATKCVARRTVGSEALAEKIAGAVQRAKAEPRGLFCPRDDGSGVQIYTRYADGRDEYARVELTGCSTISAPGRASREDTSRLRQALGAAAPNGWKSYFNS